MSNYIFKPFVISSITGFEDATISGGNVYVTSPTCNGISSKGEQVGYTYVDVGDKRILTNNILLDFSGENNTGFSTNIPSGIFGLSGKLGIAKRTRQSAKLPYATLTGDFLSPYIYDENSDAKWKQIEFDASNQINDSLENYNETITGYISSQIGTKISTYDSTIKSYIEDKISSSTPEIPDITTSIEDYVTEQFLTGDASTGISSWYRLWKNGMVQQGGEIQLNADYKSSGALLTFPLPFADTNYTCQFTFDKTIQELSGFIQINGIDDTVEISGTPVRTKTNDSIPIVGTKFSFDGSYRYITKKIHWKAIGKANTTVLLNKNIDDSTELEYQEFENLFD